MGRSFTKAIRPKGFFTNRVPSQGNGKDARFVIGLYLTYKKLLRELTFVVDEARIEARLLILDIQVSFCTNCTNFLLRYQHRHRWTLYQSGFVTLTGAFSIVRG